MTEEKKEKKPTQEELTASINAAWALLRRLKDYMEKIFGADIDGDGHIGPWKAAILAMFLGATQAFGWSVSTNHMWAQADTTGTNIIASVDTSGNLMVAGSTAGGTVSASTGVKATTNGILTVIKYGPGGTTNALAYLVPGIGASAVTNIIDADISK